MLYFMDEIYCHAKQHLPHSRNGAMISGERRGRYSNMIQYITSQKKFKSSGILCSVVWQVIADILEEHVGHP